MARRFHADARPPPGAGVRTLARVQFYNECQLPEFSAFPFCPPLPKKNSVGIYNRWKNRPETLPAPVWKSAKATDADLPFRTANRTAAKVEFALALQAGEDLPRVVLVTRTRGGRIYEVR